MGKYLDKARQLSDFSFNEKSLINTRENIEIEREESHSATLTKETNLTKEALEASTRRLEAARVSVAIWPDGRMRIVATWDTWPPGATVWTPGEMLVYINLAESERSIMRGLKGLEGKR